MKGKCVMAYIRKWRKRYKVEIRKKGFPNINRCFIDLKTARRFARDVESQMDRNVFEDYSVAQGTTLKDILIRYRDEKTAHKKGHKEETSTVNFLIRHQISFNSLMRLRSHHIYKLMKELGQTRANATVKKYINILCHAWRVAKKEWGINLPLENPCDMVTMPKVNDARSRIPTKDEYAKLLDACSESNLSILKDIVIFASSTGARQGEILKLKREHIDFKKKQITFYDTKNTLDRTIPAPDNVLAILKNYRFGEFVFNTLARRLRKHFTRACKKAGIEDLRFHDLRAFFATNALLSGMQIEQVSFITGHRDWSQLKRYTRIKPEDLLEKVNNVVNLK
jgi:integrase